MIDIEIVNTLWQGGPHSSTRIHSPSYIVLW